MLVTIHHLIMTSILTVIGEIEHSAHDFGIKKVPAIIAHSTPSIVETDFKAAFSVIAPTNQPDVSVRTHCIEMVQ